MIKIVTEGGASAREYVKLLKERNREAGLKVENAVAEILDTVRRDGDSAVRMYAGRFDGGAPESLELPRDQVEALAEKADPLFVESLKKAAANIRDFHERQKQQSWLTTREDGVLMGQRIRGLSRVGLYVPGGTAAYPSSVLMNAIPAKIAGVDRVFLMGGAQAVAALAYGTETVPKVDKIVGPGNIYVATAKKQLYGTVDIDMVAGPSEILVLADETANPRYLAADLMSQAEHDPMASAILLTTSEAIARETAAELERQVQTLSRKDIILESLSNFGAILVCSTMEEAVGFANELAPEHLEVCVRDPMEYIGRLDNAGSMFLGNYSPEPLGDYFAGPNHVLPTNGTAKFFSPLGVDDFIKKSSIIYYTRSALLPQADDIIRLAQAEGLTAHANSIQVRKEEP